MLLFLLSCFISVVVVDLSHIPVFSLNTILMDLVAWSTQPRNGSSKIIKGFPGEFYLPVGPLHTQQAKDQQEPPQCTMEERSNLTTTW